MHAKVQRVRMTLRLSKWRKGVEKEGFGVCRADNYPVKRSVNPCPDMFASCNSVTTMFFVAIGDLEIEYFVQIPSYKRGPLFTLPL